MKDRIVIEKDHAGIWAWEKGTYPRSSVLAGRPRNARLECFDTFEEAIAAYPDAEVDREGCSGHQDNLDLRAQLENDPDPGLDESY